MINYILYLLLLPSLVYIFYVWRMINGITTPQIEMSYDKRSVSIILIAQNDHWAMHQTLFSLANQSYPTDLYQVYIAVQELSDDLRKYVSEYIAKLDNFQIIPFDRNNFIDRFSDLNRGELILFVSAGTELSRLWIETMAIQMDEEIDLLIGFNEPRFRSVTNNLMDIAYYGEVLFSSFVSAGALSLGKRFIFDTGNVAIDFNVFQRLLAYHRVHNSPVELRHTLLKRAQKNLCRAKFSFMEHSIVRSNSNFSRDFFAKNRSWYSSVSTEDRKEKELIIFKLSTIIAKLFAFGHICIFFEYLLMKHGSKVFGIKKHEIKYDRINFYIVWLIIHPFIILYNIIRGLFSVEQKQ